MTRLICVLVALLGLPIFADAQDATSEKAGVAERAKSFYEMLFTKTLRLALEPIAPTAGVTVGIGVKPKDWRTESLTKSLRARASGSANRYWAVDGSFSWQSTNQWRIEPYARFRSMKRLSYYGLGNESDVENRADFAMLERRVGVYGFKRPVGWFAIGARVEGMWPRTSAGQSPSVPSVEEAFPGSSLPGFMERTNFIYASVFTNVNYPYVRSERPRRGGDYTAALAVFHDASGTGNSFKRLEVEGQERFPIAGSDRQLTLHARLSSSFASSGQAVPFYLMDTLGGADNLRGFKEAIIGSDETTATLRSFDSFRFRDKATALFQAELRQRLVSQLFISIFADAGMVASTVGDLGSAKLHKGIGLGLSLYKVNALAVRFELSLWGGERRPHYITPGHGLAF